ncbi:MAG TPA: hypothetical protein VGA56_07475 [Opitutaceae bacterium]
MATPEFCSFFRNLSMTRDQSDAVEGGEDEAEDLSELDPFDEFPESAVAEPAAAEPAAAGAGFSGLDASAFCALRL